MRRTFYGGKVSVHFISDHWHWKHSPVVGQNHLYPRCPSDRRRCRWWQNNARTNELPHAHWIIETLVSFNAIRWHFFRQLKQFFSAFYRTVHYFLLFVFPVGSLRWYEKSLDNENALFMANDNTKWRKKEAHNFCQDFGAMCTLRWWPEDMPRQKKTCKTKSINQLLIAMSVMFELNRNRWMSTNTSFPFLRSRRMLSVFCRIVSFHTTHRIVFFLAVLLSISHPVLCCCRRCWNVTKCDIIGIVDFILSWHFSFHNFRVFSLHAQAFFFFCSLCALSTISCLLSPLTTELWTNRPQTNAKIRERSRNGSTKMEEVYSVLYCILGINMFSITDRSRSSVHFHRLTRTRTFGFSVVAFWQTISVFRFYFFSLNKWHIMDWQ